MKYLVIPDVHNKVDIVDAVIAAEPHDRVIHLSDFFDDWGDGPQAAKKTALRVKEYLSRDICVLGNHDQSYWLGPGNSSHICSGFTWSKCREIYSVLGSSDWEKFRLFYWIEEGNWLVTHAGLDKFYVKDCLPGKVIDDAWVSLLNPEPTVKGNHPLLHAGYDRGGCQRFGGITWSDWRRLETPPGYNQLVGHTEGKEVRTKTDSTGKYQAVCIDTRMNHYAILEGGQLTIKTVKDLLGY